MKKAYRKPVLIAKNSPNGSFAAGCPTVDAGGGCYSKCEIRK